MMCRRALFHIPKNSYLDENPNANLVLHSAFLESVLAQGMLRALPFLPSRNIIGE